MKTRTLLLLILSLSLLPIFSVSSDSSTLERLDTWLEAQFPRNGSPAMAVAVTDQEGLVYSRVFGDADPDATFYIASLSKSITATAVLLLVQDGLVDLDAPVQQYLPTFTTTDPAHAAAVTVRHLLNQTSGLSDSGYQPKPESFASLEAMLADLAAAQPVAPPGETFNYFNPNYQTLGLLVETVSGTPFESFVQERVFNPSGMGTAGFAPDARTLRGYNLAFGQPIFLYDTMQPPAPSGGAVASAEDMARLVQLYLDGGASLLEPDLAKLAITPSGVDGDPGAPSGYAMGWYTSSFDGIDALVHGGDIDSFHADMALLPDAGYGVVILYNTNNLIANFTLFPATLNGVVTILAGREAPETSFSMQSTGLVMLAWLLWAMSSGIRRAFRISAWVQKTRGWKPARIGLSLGTNLLPMLILILLPQLVLLISGRAASHRLLFSYLPDVFLVLAAAGVLGVLHFVLRLRALLQTIRPAA